MTKLFTTVNRMAALLLPLALAAVMQPVAADEDEIPFAEAHIFFELNNTDGDLGIHSLIDGDPWKRLRIEGPRGRKLLKVRVKGNLRNQGLTEFFFESAEPPFESDDPDVVTLTPEEFFERFREGEYEIEGRSLAGDELESTTVVTHTMPAPPVPTVNGQPMAEQCDDEEPGYDASQVSAPVTIAWLPVTTSHPDLGTQPPVGVTIHNYEVVVETDIEVDGEEFTTKFSAIVPPGVTSMTIPAEFIAQAGQFKYEVLAREESYNQTAVESCLEITD